jgi:thymidine kinase
MGVLNIVFGPMYSGKSTELIRIYNKYKLKNKILVINHISDNRYSGNSVNTHNNNNLNCVLFKKLTDYYTLFTNESKDNYDILLIDESQFFNDLYSFCKNLVDSTNKIIYIFGLSGDSNREKFGQINDLIPIADSITQLKAICNNCTETKDAPFTMRKTSNKEQISVGGTDEYMAVCRDCWLKNNKT